MVLVRERRPDRPGRASLVAVIEMVDVMVIEIHRLLDQPQAERRHAQIQIILCIVDSRRDMVETKDGMFHESTKIP